MLENPNNQARDPTEGRAKIALEVFKSYRKEHGFTFSDNVEDGTDIGVPAKSAHEAEKLILQMYDEIKARVGDKFPIKVQIVNQTIYVGTPYINIEEVKKKDGIGVPRQEMLF